MSKYKQIIKGADIMIAELFKTFLEASGYFSILFYSKAANNDENNNKF
ncbi:Uncharacterized protein dnl_10310 [Desulfonema limicola]|uniref:Uncharacterized protein n=1 Tax=Desulfonema limicola TaxID=45656 RepID=A0A975GF22_9BACT|nr:Uncharacterized protein dnl_10310 [Desulfonema limicola]